MDYSAVLDPREDAFAAGVSSGTAAGECLAQEDGARLGALHGAALGSELGALEGFTLALSLLAGAEDGGGDAGGGGAEAAEAAAQRAPARVRRAAASVRDRVAPLALASGGPVPAQAGVFDAVQQCRAAAKVCCTAAGFPPAAADFAFRSGGELAGEAAAPLAAKEGFSF